MQEILTGAANYANFLFAKDTTSGIYLGAGGVSFTAVSFTKAAFNCIDGAMANITAACLS
jgi:hypothetical protein